MSYNLPLIWDGISIFFSIIIEALPYITLGVIVSSLLSIFISDEILLRCLPKNTFLSLIVISLVGFIFPVCECGNIPVARRLLAKGVEIPQVVTFLLAASTFNPIVIFSTYTAFRSTPEIVFYRIVISLMIAIVVGCIVSLLPNRGKILTASMQEACSREQTHTDHKTIQKIGSVFGKEITQGIGALLLGAFIAAILATFSKNAITHLAISPLLAIVSLMILAMVMTVCSTVNAFVALGFVGLFPTSAILAFLIFGPMADLRVLSMTSSMFRFRYLALIFFLVAQCLIIGSSLVSIIGK